MKKKAIPVIMYHSIGIPNNRWQWNHLTCPYLVFESQLKWLHRSRFHTISLQQLYEYMERGEKLPKNSVVLTFDDGYLDNWVFAYPLLKKYNFQATIYISPEFVDNRNIVRKNLEDFWRGDVKLDELENIGYLSWLELKKMEMDRTIDVQSHTMTHTWYPSNGKIIDFRNPNDPYIWMTWNSNQIKKPILQVDRKEMVRYGQPVYKNNRALGIKRFFPDKHLDEYIIDHVKDKGGIDFFININWKKELFKIVENYKQENKLNEKYESDEEYTDRIYYEVYKSKEIIENELDKDVSFICWPGGVTTEKGLKIASEVGYKSSTAGKDVKIIQRKKIKNRYGDNPKRIRRISTVLYWDGIEAQGSKIIYKNGLNTILSLYWFQGKKVIAPFYFLNSKYLITIDKIRH